MERFTICSTQEINESVAEATSYNTRKNNVWCTKVYADWVSWRNIESDRHFPSLEELWTADKKLISNALCHFIYEIKRKDGADYPPNTLYNIVCGLARHVKVEQPDLQIMSKDDMTFAYFHKCLNAKMIDLTKKGIGVSRTQANPVLRNDEVQLWEKNAFSMNDSFGLLRAVYFYMCKAFGLRAADEHRKLDIDQMTFGEDSNGKYVQFSGRSDKVYKGGLKDRQHVAKDIKQYDSNNERSIYKIIEQYMKALQRCDIFHGSFYRRPLNVISNLPRFGKSPVGVNKIAKLLPDAARIAGLCGRFTGHSGKVTCATTLFHQEFDEQLIKQRTGHRSNSIRAYKRINEDQQMSVSAALEPPAPKKCLIDCFKTSSSDFDLNLDFE